MSIERQAAGATVTSAGRESDLFELLAQRGRPLPHAQVAEACELRAVAQRLAVARSGSFAAAARGCRGNRSRRPCRSH